jgi:hypothetical protein
MKEIAGRIAVVTGGGSGMGRELVRQLVAEACNVSMCDLAAEGMAETVRLCEAAGLPQGLRVTTHIADVSDFAQMGRFRDEVADRHATDRIHLPAPHIKCSVVMPGHIGTSIPLNTRKVQSGNQADKIDELVRQPPERAYDVDFFEQFAREVGWRLPT